MMAKVNFRRGLAGLVLLGGLAGCAQTSVNVQSMSSSAVNPVIQAAGTARTLGFDSDRYQNVLAKAARPVRLPRQGLLPEQVDLRANCSAVADQGKLGSCTAFAMGKGLREYMQRRWNERQEPLSALFHYYEIRASRGSINRDSGGTITEGMNVLKRTGIAAEATWGYDIARFTIKPPADAYASAGEFKTRTNTQLDGLDDVKASLADGNVVAFGFIVYESFKKIGTDGMMSKPAFTERRLGGHAVLAVGYDNTRNVLICRNSWSEKWGDKGYFYMPYGVASSGQAMDFWTAR